MFSKYFIKKKSQLNHNTIHLVISPLTRQIKKYPISSFIYIASDDEAIKRPYTPIKTSPSEIELAIKIYKEGKLTQMINQKQESDFLKCSDAIPKRKYILNEFKNVLLIAGGTGITPMTQLLDFCIGNPENKTKFVLIFCNKTEKDIFMLEKLESYGIKIVHVLEDCESETKNKICGRINSNIIYDVINENDEIFDFVYVCGPPPMITLLAGSKGLNGEQGAFDGILKDIGFNENEVYKF
ncbi:NADH-cytochrome b5 reductase 2 [Astathelohania contejeani]|uniref:NADH-cytochrome b5 reductase 2 n=1 Tax=Astathelohania contejeani TaxID=164912 RepID=A0ABQ7HXW1_9MICR|nr:NADH-cytochrome b5 reductase 2 [Thelohania contejeani]